MAGAKIRGLGKGLEALFNDVEISTKEISTKEINETSEETLEEGRISILNINDIKPNEGQPRKNFNEDKIDELAESIEAHGIIQPIMVRPTSGGYEIVAGERRWRAARKAGLKKVPCIVKELDEEQNMLVAIIENMQREDLNPMEEAEALNQMVEIYGFTQEEVSKSVGKSRPYITNALRLLKLPKEIRDFVTIGKLTNGHARALAGMKDQEAQVLLARKAVETGMSVREIETLANADGELKKPVKKKPGKAREILDVETELKTLLGTKVLIQHKGKNGKIELEYYSREELDRLIELLRTLKSS